MMVLLPPPPLLLLLLLLLLLFMKILNRRKYSPPSRSSSTGTWSLLLYSPAHSPPITRDMTQYKAATTTTMWHVTHTCRKNTTIPLAVACRFGSNTTNTTTYTCIIMTTTAPAAAAAAVNSLSSGAASHASQPNLTHKTSYNIRGRHLQPTSPRPSSPTVL